MKHWINNIASIYESMLFEHFTPTKTAISFDPAKGDREFYIAKFAKQLSKLGGKGDQVRKKVKQVIDEWHSLKGSKPIFELKGGASINPSSLGPDIWNIFNETTKKHGQSRVVQMPLYGIQISHREPPTHLLALLIPTNLLTKSANIIVWVRAFDVYDSYLKEIDRVRHQGL